MANLGETPTLLHVESPSTNNGRDYAERELQNFLVRNPGKLGIPDATIIASEYQTEVGRIDLLVGSGPDTVWVVELKAGVASRDAIGQILSYIGAVRKEHRGKAVCGLLVAPDFDESCLAAHGQIGDVELKRVRIQYALEQAAPLNLYKGHIPIAAEGSSNRSRVFAKRSDGGNTVHCWRCGVEREVSPAAEAFSCASCDAFNNI